MPVRINDASVDRLDEPTRQVGLEVLRRRNNQRVVDRLVRLGLRPGADVLDVGCAHGWFMEEAARRGLTPVGIEPDDGVRRVARDHGFDVRDGLFPDALGEDESFDAIAFNDVLEHVPDVAATLAAVRRHLRPGGLLSLNVPTSSGIVFRVSTAAARHGRLRDVHARLWQVGFPSPHLWYFDEDNLTMLCEAAQFERVHSGALASMSVRGLWSRAHFDRAVTARSALTVTAGCLAAPLLNRPMLSDVMHLVLRAPGVTPPR